MNSKQSNELRLWISQDFYIPVDDQGFCVGRYYEGAMGIVVEIRRFNGGSYALKIPWLMGDTSKENAHVAALLAEERDSVLDIFSDRNNTTGLMYAEAFGASILQKPIQAKGGSQEVKAFHDGSIAVQFIKGRPPRFCVIQTIREGQDSLKIFPEAVDDCPLVNKKVFIKAYQQGKENDIVWQNPVAVNMEGDRSGFRIFTLKSCFDHQLSSKIWYLGVPAVIYVWGSSTLHEAVSQGKLATWDLEQHIRLLDRIANGIHSLHKRGYLHTDLRPANIMARGDCDDPDNYFLIDYAGYNLGLKPPEGQEMVADDSETTPDLLGPSVGGERNSPFYAPERRKGIEKEGADIAVILDRKDHYLIVFGWRNRILDKDGIEIVDSILNELQRYKFDAVHASATRHNHLKFGFGENDILLPGDRLQIREFIFKIEAIGSLSGHLSGEEVYKCSKKCWKIFHGRIAIQHTEKLTQEWMAIPRVIELRQWAAGTDIFGIGALFLYTLFRKTGDSLNELKVAEEMAFQRLLEELQNPHYLDTIWYELSRICTQLSICHSQLRARDDIRKIMFKPDAFWDQSRLIAYTNEKSIDDYAQSITNLIIHTAPDSLVVLENLKHNYIYFLYVIYFTLCCLHRQQAMKRDLLNADSKIPGEFGFQDKLFLPFCNSRTAPPAAEEDDAPIVMMLEYIKKFKRIVESGYYQEFVMDRREHSEPENTPVPILRREISLLKQQLEEQNTVNENLSSEINQLSKKNNDQETRMLDIDERLDTIDRFAGKMDKKVFYKSHQVETLIREINLIKNLHKN